MVQLRFIKHDYKTLYVACATFPIGCAFQGISTGLYVIIIEDFFQKAGSTMALA